MSARSRSTPPRLPPVRIVRTRRGISLVQGRDVLSDTLAAPGPTHGLFDVLAACMVAGLPGARAGEPPARARVAMLGFAAGGVVGPLRAMGYAGRLDAVDLSLAPAALFRALCAEWAGDVRLQEADAAAWLRGRRHPYDVILEDITVPGPQGATKPAVSLDTLPQLLPRALAPGGRAIVNVLPVPGLSWDALFERLAGEAPAVQVVHCEDFVNRVLLTGARLPSARTTASALRAALRRIRSRQQSRITVERRA